MTHKELSSTALLLIDIQNDYFPNGRYPLTGSPEAGQQARMLLDAFRERKLPIFHIQHENTGDAPKLFAPGTDGQKIHDTVQPLPEETVLVKHERSSFVRTSLLEDLQSPGIDTLILAGMQTNVCVQATTKDALKHDFTVIAAHDATAAVDESTHVKTLEKLAKKGAAVMSVEDILSRLP